MGVILSGETLPNRPTTPAQEADAATYVCRVAAVQGWAPGDVLANVGTRRCGMSGPSAEKGLVEELLPVVLAASPGTPTLTCRKIAEAVAAHMSTRPIPPTSDGAQ